MKIQTLDCAKIEFPETKNSGPSFQKEVAETLAMSIEAGGMFHPIVVRDNLDKPGTYKGVLGRHRLHAQHQILGKTTIDCYVLILDDDDVAMATLAENTFRKALSQAEKSKGIRKWFQMFEAKYPERVGRGKAGSIARKVKKDAEKAAKAPRRDRSETKVHEPEVSGTASTNQAKTEGDDPKLNLGFEAAEGETKVSGATETEGDDPKPNLGFEATEDKTDEASQPSSFAQTLAAVTGVSQAAAKREQRIALNLSDDELETCQRHELTKGQMESIAAIKDRAQRVQLFDRLTKMDFEDAWEDIDPEAKRVTGKSRRQEAAEAAAKAEQQPELSDDAWIDKNCGETAQRLADSISFRYDALLYREIAEARRLFRVKIERILEVAKWKPTGPFYQALNCVVAVNHPKDWVPCPSCVRGKDKAGKACRKCQETGYRLTLEDEPGAAATLASEHAARFGSRPIPCPEFVATTPESRPQPSPA